MHYQIKSFTLRNTTTLNYEILKQNWIFKQEMMVEMICKRSVGGSSEGLINESLSRSFKRQIHQIFMHGLMKQTQPIGSKHWIIQQWLGWLWQKCKWPDITVYAHWTVYDWCCLTRCILNIKTLHVEFVPQYAEFLRDFSWRCCVDFINPFSVSKHSEVFLWAELSWRQKESPERFTNATGEVCSLSITGEIQVLPAYVRSLTHSTKRFTLTDETRSADPHTLLLKGWTIWQESSDSNVYSLDKLTVSI